MKNIETIQKLDVEAMRELIGIGDEAVVVSNEAEMIQFIKGIDLTEFTGIEIGQMVNYILPDHVDNAPSATIYKDKYGLPNELSGQSSVIVKVR